MYQSLYKRLNEDGLLRMVGLENFSIGHTLMVGVADPKDLEKFPELGSPFVTFPFVIGGDFKNNKSMIKEFEDFACPLGVTMGDIIADAPEDCISKVSLEERVLKTGYHGRTALIGD
ncbi:hypothetical protein BGZ79_008160, partial [Entomortierella chlamydospora]